MRFNTDYIKNAAYFLEAHIIDKLFIKCNN